MEKRTLTAIAAFARNHVIGRDNGMAWNLVNLSIVGWLYWRVRHQVVGVGRMQARPG